MLCRNCNTENAETAKFCVNCGQALADVSTSEPVALIAQVGARTAR